MNAMHFILTVLSWKVCKKLHSIEKYKEIMLYILKLIKGSTFAHYYGSLIMSTN